MIFHVDLQPQQRIRTPAAQHLTSGMTVTETEFASTWVVTKSDGSVFTESGIVGQSGTSFTTLTTFAPTTSSGAVQTEYTSTWEVTNTDGSVSTKSGIVDQSGTYFTTLSTFVQLPFLVLLKLNLHQHG